MVKSYKTLSVLPYSWTNVALAFFHRYPNPNSFHVLTVDTIERRVTTEGYLYTKRLLTKTNKVPKWGKFLFKNKSPSTTVIEESLIDPVQMTISTFTRNIGLTSLMCVTEKNLYERKMPQKLNSSSNNSKSTLPEESYETVLSKEAVIESKLYGLRHALESFGLDRFKKNSVKANLGFLYVLERKFGKPIEVKESPVVIEGEIVEERGGLKKYLGFFTWPRFLSKNSEL